MLLLLNMIVQQCQSNRPPNYVGFTNGRMAVRPRRGMTDYDQGY